LILTSKLIVFLQVHFECSLQPFLPMVEDRMTRRIPHPVKLRVIYRAQSKKPAEIVGW